MSDGVKLFLRVLGSICSWVSSIFVKQLGAAFLGWDDRCCFPRPIHPEQALGAWGFGGGRILAKEERSIGRCLSPGAGGSGSIR